CYGCGGPLDGSICRQCNCGRCGNMRYGGICFIESETKNELYKMMEAYTERMNQQREQEALLAAQREQELLAQRQAAQENEEPPQNSDLLKKCLAQKQVRSKRKNWKK
ncbi:hypothetical protein Tco_1390129, partial [Tanacetum coccineum]